MRRLAFAVFVCLAAHLQGAALPPPPADGVWDNAHALEETVHAEIAREFGGFGEELGIKPWLFAVTFVPDSQPLRAYARELRQSWSGGADAILIGYDRVSDSQSISFSPSLWEHYPSAELILLMQAGAAVMAEKELPLDQRLVKSARLTLTRLRELEQERLRMTGILPPSHQRLAKSCAGLLSAAALGLLLLGGTVRKRETLSRWHLLFPEVQVAPRFGAPRGGGATVTRSRRG
ncbi:MAG TPA: hypothetical protein VD994_06630 [Prosthecobacter sp.]|nr:hypothetical protein [Prosthecobacter sp.]